MTTTVSPRLPSGVVLGTPTSTYGGVSTRYPWLCILDYGGDNTGGTDNAAAWDLMMADAVKQTNGAGIYFPKGDYKFSSQPTFTHPGVLFSLSFQGDSQGSSRLLFS